MRRFILFCVALCATAFAGSPAQAVTRPGLAEEGWYQQNTAPIYTGADGLQITFDRAYVYPHPSDVPLWWTARIIYRNTGSGNIALTCVGQTDPRLVYEDMAGTGNSGRVYASATFCSAHPTWTGTLAPGATYESWALFHNVSWLNGTVAVGWSQFGASAPVDIWADPLNVSSPPSEPANPEPPPPTPTCPSNPAVMFSPGGGDPGMLFSATGSGWLPGGIVNIRMGNTGGAIQGNLNPTAVGNGTFSAQMAFMPGAALGAQTVVFTENYGGCSLTASQTFIMGGIILKAVAIDSHTIRLDWIDNQPFRTRYTVNEQKKDEWRAFAPYMRTTDWTGLDANTKYCFRIRADYGTSDPNSNVGIWYPNDALGYVCVTTPPAPTSSGNPPNGGNPPNNSGLPPGGQWVCLGPSDPKNCAGGPMTVQSFRNSERQAVAPMQELGALKLAQNGGYRLRLGTPQAGTWDMTVKSGQIVIIHIRVVLTGHGSRAIVVRLTSPGRHYLRHLRHSIVVKVQTTFTRRGHRVMRVSQALRLPK